MKTKKQLDLLSAQIGEAILNYHKAIENNLLELGHPVSVQGDDENVLGIKVGVIFDNAVDLHVIDQIRCNESGVMQVHLREFNEEATDEWEHVSELGDAEDYVLEAIQWIDRDKLMKVDGNVWQGTANEIYSFCDCHISLYFIHDNGRIEDVAWHDSIEDFADANGVFAVETEQYDEAIRQLENRND